MQASSNAASEVNHCLMRFEGGIMSSVSSVTFWNQRFRTVSKTEGLKVACSDSATAGEGSVMAINCSEQDIMKSGGFYR